jgi:hypothetical protein
MIAAFVVGSQLRTRVLVTWVADEMRGAKVSSSSPMVRARRRRDTVVVAFTKSRRPPRTEISYPISRARARRNSQSVALSCARWVCTTVVASIRPAARPWDPAIAFATSESVTLFQPLVIGARCSRCAAS